MFAGHVGIGLAIGRAERRMNVGAFVAAALLLDLLLWAFVLLGWESADIPANFVETRQPSFHFPYSHSLLAAVLWSAFAAALVLMRRALESRWRAGALIAAAVFSHWLLDALVHGPEMPLAGESSPMAGLALWDRLPIALAVEAAIAVIGLALFLAGSRLSRGRSIALVVLCLILLGFTIAGMTIAPPPPSAIAMAGSSLATLVVVCAVFAWIGRQPKEGTP